MKCRTRMTSGINRFCNPGVTNRCSRKIFKEIGARIIKARAGTKPVKSKSPQTVSVNFNKGKKYFAAIIPFMNVCKSCGISGGGGMRLKSPAAPNTKKIRPSKYLAAIKIFFFTNDLQRCCVVVQKCTNQFFVLFDQCTHMLIYF